MRTRILTLSGLALAAVMAVAGCAHGGGQPSAADASASAKAAALANQLKHDSKLMADEKKAIREVESCAKSQAGMTIVIPVPGSTTQPSISGVRLHDVDHPISTVEAILHCTPAGKHGVKALDKCVKKVVLAGGFGRGKLEADLNNAATVCVAGIQS